MEARDDDRRWTRWERARRGGGARFVWKYGVCGFGLLGFLAAFAVAALSPGRSVFAVALVPLATTLIGAWGAWMFWRLAECRFLEAMEKRLQRETLAAMASDVRELREMFEARA